ncbi:AMP-binding enzyme [Actinomadura madurae]|uniref:AMP-binding enzyme n=1 Tax=Actinomadura madurae TaxID=1993 RepID=UPI003556FD4B
MVKVSGYRIELGEIEAVVLRHPAIAEAAVLVTGEGTDARLALYYAVRDGAEAPGLIEVKRHCAEHLPKYMVPHAATRLAALPRNSNGKVDLGGSAAARRPARPPRPPLVMSGGTMTRTHLIDGHWAAPNRRRWRGSCGTTSGGRRTGSRTGS